MLRHNRCSLLFIYTGVNYTIPATTRVFYACFMQPQGLKLLFSTRKQNLESLLFRKYCVTPETTDKTNIEFVEIKFKIIGNQKYTGTHFKYIFPFFPFTIFRICTNYLAMLLNSSLSTLYLIIKLKFTRNEWNFTKSLKT